MEAIKCRWEAKINVSFLLWDGLEASCAPSGNSINRLGGQLRAQHMKS